MNEIIDFMRWLDESNAAYLVMITLFLIMAFLQNESANEVARLRKLLKQAMR